MSYKFKEVMQKPERLSGGHRMCAGCGAPVAVRSVLRTLDPEEKAVIGCATGCLEVSTFLYPYTAWQDSFIHTAFENAAATVSGVEAAHKALLRKGKIRHSAKMITFGGDGGSYDIGLQSLSGAMERGHDMVYVCYNNGAYMNTGIQRSSATPMYADTTTSPAGSVKQGKGQFSKDLTRIIASHQIPYVAQTTFLTNMKDLHEKAEKAVRGEGSAFMNVLAPCPRGWRYDTEKLMDICKLAVDTCYWPMYEVEYGRTWKLSYKPKEKLPLVEFLKPQGRFKHLLKPENKPLLDKFQQEIDVRWENLLSLCGEN